MVGVPDTESHEESEGIVNLEQRHAHMYACAPCVCPVPQRSENASDVLVLDMETVVSHHVGAEN